ncbi:MAG TPA: PAS domain S-box protein [Pyrinomonadaceae bacterium]|nr:PAS domain S-box protein [Pyrinomonadaceae bacterium]
MAGSPLNQHPRTNVWTNSERRSSALKIICCYVLFGCLWILFSDELLSALISNKETLTHWQILKGWAFIAITAGLLYTLIIRSISTIQRTNDALQKSEARLRRIVESDMIGIVFWNTSGQAVDANDAFLEIVGYTREELVEGKINWREMTPAEFRRLDEHAGEERRLRGSSLPYEKEYIRKDGRRVCVLVGIATLNEAEGTNVAFVLDITKRKRVEQALRTSERQLREILENIQLLSVMFDQDGALMFCNDFLLGLTGWRFEDVIGRNWFTTFVAPEQRELIKFTFDEMIKKGTSPSHIEYEVQTRGGERRTISWSNTVMRDLTGQLVGITCIGEDVTERKRAEEKLRTSYEESRALSAHLQSVREEERIRIAREIHDVLGQALTGLKMDVWWLIKRLSNTSKSLEKGALLEKFETMSDLINSTIVSVRKLATELRPGVLDDLGLVAAIEWQAREFQTRTGINCHLSLPPEDIDIGSQQSTAVFRIFQEILTNVARHANARNVEVRMNKTEDDLRLEVRDDGRGIAEDQISGVGSLGLLGMRERALLFGGEVLIRPAHGQGTIVTARIPLRRTDHPLAELERTQEVT